MQLTEVGNLRAAPHLQLIAPHMQADATTIQIVWKQAALIMLATIKSAKVFT